MNHVEEDEDRGSVENNGNTFLLKIHVLTDFFLNGCHCYTKVMCAAGLQARCFLGAQGKITAM